MKTEGAVLRVLGEPLTLEVLTTPTLGHGQVLVDVAFSGVCGSQLLEVRGRRGRDPHLPHTLGHEGSGTVLDVGSGVRKVKPGDRVILSWIQGSGLDAPSTSYDSAAGRVNSGAISTFLRQAVIAENRLVPFPRDVPMREAALFGCAVPTGAGLAMEAGVGPGASVAVLGCGGIGLCAVMMAKALGAAVVIAVDVRPGKLEMARDVGATHTVDASAHDAVEAILALTGGAGVDFAFETAGSKRTTEAAFASVRVDGGLAVVAGNVAYGERISIDPMDLIRGRRIVGSWGGGCVPDRDIPRLADLYVRGALPMGKLLTHTYALGDVNRALDDLEAGKVGRSILDMSRPQ